MAYEDRIMRMADSVPQRTVRPGDSRPNIGFDRAGPARREPATYPHEAAHLNMGDRAYNQPGFERPMTNVPVGSPNIGRDRMGGIFGGTRTSGASDMVNAMLGGMETSQLRREEELGGAQEPGFDVAQYTDDDKVIKRKLWPMAVNAFPPGTPEPQIVQEWERLQEEYWRLKAQGYSPGE